MNTGTKVTVGLGAVMIIGGILVTVLGAGAVGGADWRFVLLLLVLRCFEQSRSGLRFRLSLLV